MSHQKNNKLRFRNFVFILIVLTLAGFIGYVLGTNSSSSKANSSISHTLKQKRNVITISAQKNALFPVVKVIDGDTIETFINGRKELVRLLGINTPEVENKYRHQECFGPEASKEAKKLLTNKKVYLLPDPAVPNRGKYHRLLRYVFLPSGEFINAELIKNGYAFEYIYQPFQFMKYFHLLESEAKQNRLGLWSSQCDYYFE